MLIGLILGQLIALLNSSPYLGVKILISFGLLFAFHLKLVVVGRGTKSNGVRGFWAYTIRKGES